MEDTVVQQAEDFVRTLLAKEGREGLSYHDIIHTEYVAGMARKIAQNSGLSKEELNTAVVAAWFHDCGFVVRSEGHEAESQTIAQKFLSSKGVSENLIEKVVQCIKATKMPQSPGESMLAKVLCDADMAYLSEDFYIQRTKLLRKEWNHESERKLSREAYYRETIELFDGKADFVELLL